MKRTSTENRERILKPVREKEQVMYKVKPSMYKVKPSKSQQISQQKP
jgi:hypothetical protein